MKNILLIIITSTLVTSVCATVNMRDSVIEWRHFDFAIASSGALQNVDTQNKVITRFNAKVMENEFLRVVLVPEFGGRAISMFNKTTGHEELYRNPVSNPYGRGIGAFYYDWLLVYGGIFPTFSVAEHGKFWFLPWATEVLSDSEDHVAIKFSQRDTIDYSGAPPSFVYGETGIECQVTYALYAGRPFLELKVELINPANHSVDYEYWTTTTLSPGSPPEAPASPSNSEIISPLQEVDFYGVENWPWLGGAEQPTSGGAYEFKNLRYLSNWEDQGIIYAHPQMQGNWWGVLNHDQNEGILRVSDNINHTIGMKFWTWGDRPGTNANPENFNDEARPFIELWAGVSRQFWQPAVLNAGEYKTWREYYYPIKGMSAVTDANHNMALHLPQPGQSGGEWLYHTSLYPTTTDQLRLLYSLDGSASVLKDTTVMVSAQQLRQITFAASEGSENSTYQLQVFNSAGTQIYPQDIPTSDIVYISKGPNSPPNLQLKSWSSEGRLTLSLTNTNIPSLVEIRTIKGRLVQTIDLHPGELKSLDLNPGLYILNIPGTTLSSKAFIR